MSLYYYNNNIGALSNSTSVNDFAITGTPSYYQNFSGFNNRYIPYYAFHSSLEEWEYGIGYVNGTTIIRSGIYSSSNNNNKVSFSAGSKTIYGVINAERINHGGYNYLYSSGNFTIEPFQTIFGVLSSGSIAATGFLPAASGNENLLLGFRLLGGSSKNLVIDASGSELIDGAATLTLTPSQRFVSIISDGSGWYSLNNALDVTGSGLPSGNIGAIQYKASSSAMGGSDALFWSATTGILLIGNSGISTANIILPGSGSGINTVFNNLGYDADFVVKGTGTRQVYYDASTGRLGINTSTPSAIIHAVGECANETLRLESTTACNTGAALTLYHGPSTGSSPGSFPAIINLAGRNSNGQEVNFARIRSRVLGTGINATSGELYVDVDYTGVPTNIMVLSTSQAVLGLRSSGSNRNNILLGNFSTDSGLFNNTVGHFSVISGVSSSGNTLLGSNSSLSGNGNFIGGNFSAVTGTDNTLIGNNNGISGSGSQVVGRFNNILGTGVSVVGNNNSSTTSLSFVEINGGSNTIASGISGVVNGFSNTVRSSNFTLDGFSNNLSGNDAVLMGNRSIISGNNNICIGLNNRVVGTGNLAFGSNITITGTSGIIIGNNISTSVTSGIVLGFNNPDMIVFNTGILFNPDRQSTFLFHIPTTGNSGLFFNSNSLGINVLPTGGYNLDVGLSGNIRTSGLRIGSTTTNNSFAISDTSGNVSWQPFDTAQSLLVISGLSSGTLPFFNGSGLRNASGLYWTNSTGLYISPSGSNNNIGFANIILPTGGTAVFNGNRQTSTSVFEIRGTSANLLTADSLNNRLGINLVPSYSLDVSGTARIASGTLSFIEKNPTQFIMAFDTSVSSFHRLSVTSTGIFAQQASTGLIPKIVYSASQQSAGFLADSVNTLNAPATGINYLKFLSWDSNDSQVKYTDDMYAGFGVFNGTTDA